MLAGHCYKSSCSCCHSYLHKCNRCWWFFLICFQKLPGSSKPSHNPVDILLQAEHSSNLLIQWHSCTIFFLLFESVLLHSSVIFCQAQKPEAGWVLFPARRLWIWDTKNLNCFSSLLLWHWSRNRNSSTHYLTIIWLLFFSHCRLESEVHQEVWKQSSNSKSHISKGHQHPRTKY